MAIIVGIDGKLCSGTDARISVFDRGFLYGDSVFETIRTYQGKPFALDEHLRRFEKSAALVYIPVPVPLVQLSSEIHEALAAAQNPESYVRLILTRGQGALGLDPGLADVPRRVIITAPLAPPPPEAYAQGVSVVTWRTQRYTDETGAEGAKIGNYLVSVLAVREARRAGAHEALIVNRKGQVIEGASSNVFWVKDGVLLTPAVEEGILPGITRAHVLSVAESLRVECRLQAPSVEELCQADEAFISSSIRELLPVVRVDNEVVGDGQPGAMTRSLHQAFRQAALASISSESED